jgi:hypothetical protein
MGASAHSRQPILFRNEDEMEEARKNACERDPCIVWAY